MNRRHFFKFAAVPAALLVVPTKTIFLPPRGGWHPAVLGDGYVRELSQYVINYDEMIYRYDAIGRDIWGYEHQFHVDAKKPAIEQAKLLITNYLKHEGLTAVRPQDARQFKLLLPPTCAIARYV